MIDDVEYYLVDLKSKFDKIKPNTYYLSYSGGKDSHFLYWFIKEYLKRDDIKIVGTNTYMEHHEILQRILKNSDIVLYPKLKPFDIKEKYGIPCFSKEQDFYIYYYQNALRKGKQPSKTIQQKIDGKYDKGFSGISKKAREYVKSNDAHKITHLCCYYLRKQQYKSCFTKNKKFIPIYDLSDELLDKIYEKYNIEIPEVYNHICRTGCMGCPYGSYKHDTEKELKLLNENQLKFVCKYFKESYEVLGIKIDDILNEGDNNGK